jgi:aminoglycoside 3-N-acetyltransferase
MNLDRKHVAAQFKKCGVSQGDVLFLHCDALGIADLCGINFDQKSDALFEGILDLLGPEGTLILPTFTYSATKGEVYDVQETKSDVGLLTEQFRKKMGVKRSLNPVFSVAAIGDLSNDFAFSSAIDCFGNDTCFGLLYKHNSWIFTLGCSFDRITFIHYVDQIAGVDHRFIKIFPARVRSENDFKFFDVKYLVRDPGRKTSTKLDRLKNRLIDNGKLQYAEMGRALLSGVKAQDFYNEAFEMIKAKSNVHIEEGYEI